MGRAVLATFAAIALCASVGSHSSKPDFSGTWTLISSLPTLTSANRLAIAQNESSITIDNQRYALDGAENEGVLSTQTSRVTWASSALVITKRTTGPRGDWQDLEIYSFNDAGNLVVVRILAGLPPHSMGATMAIYQKE